MCKAILLSLLLLGGCASVPRTVLTTRTDTGVITVPTQDRVPCAKLPFPKSGGLTEEESGILMARWVRMYKLCSDRGDRLITIIDNVNGLKHH